MDLCNMFLSKEGVKDLHVNSPCFDQQLHYAKTDECSTVYGSSSFHSLLPSLNPHSGFGVFEDGSSTFEELSATFAKVVQVEDPAELLSGKCINLDHYETKRNHVQSGCQEVKVDGIDSFNLNSKKRFEKSATFPCSEDRKQIAASIAVIDPSSKLFGGQKCQDLADSISVKSEKATCSRSISLPSALKLVSALKGGREREGLTPRVKMSVKWAPDVYDPPATSMSHTVKSHQHRPKAKRKDKHKHKHNKGSRSTRGNSSEKQRLSRSSLVSPNPSHHIELQSHQSNMNEMLLDGFSHSGVEITEFSNGNNELKCRSNFLAGTLSKMQFHMAEAL